MENNKNIKRTVTLDVKGLEGFLSNSELAAAKEAALAARKTLIEGTGAGSDYTGWVNLPVEYSKEEFARIKEAGARIRSNSKVFVVCGIGGSYLGARAAFEFLKHGCHNLLAERNDELQILFAGNSFSTQYLEEMLDVIGDRDFSVNVISKSGTTTETSVAFRVFKDRLIEKYGREGAAQRIYATTDSRRGTLKALADAEGYEEFVIPDAAGGRYSVLTAVGLLPMAAAGIDIDAMMQGAQLMRSYCLETPYEENDAMLYAAARNLLREKGKEIEILANYEPSFHFFGEWWKQLFGESEGKDGKGLFPAAVDCSTDLHSMGQYIQDGRRILLETVLNLTKKDDRILLKKEEGDPDGLNYLEGVSLDRINHAAMQGTMDAHRDGGVPNMMVCLEDRRAFDLGQLFYFFEFACGVSGYLLGVNPFDQPGVEAYKRNMFRLLGKPGY